MIKNIHNNQPRLSNIKKLWPYLWPENLPKAKLRFMFSFLSLLLSKICLIILPLSFKMALDALERGETATFVIWGLVGYAGFRFLSSVFNEVKEVIFERVTQRVLREASLKVFNHLFKLSLRYHLNRQTGGLSRIIERGTQAIQKLLFFLSFNIIPMLIELLLVGIFLAYYYHWMYFALMVITISCYAVFTIYLAAKRIPHIKAMNKADNASNTKAIDSLLNYETVKFFGNESFEEKQFNKALTFYEGAAIKSKTWLSYLNIGQTLIISSGLFILLSLCATEIKNGTMSVGDMVALNLYLMQLYLPLFNLGFAYREIKLALINIEEMFDVLEEKEEIKDSKEATILPSLKGDIAFKNVSFHYQKERPILKNVSFDLKAGETLAIVGPTGSGKSTLAKLLFRFYDPTDGHVQVDQQDIKHVQQRNLRSFIGVVPQDTILFNDTLYNNILYGNPYADDQCIHDCTKKAHIDTFIESLPAGYNTMVGERGLKLSGGEKQRVAIARALMKQPKIFIFDEATSALDTKTEKMIQENLQEIAKDRTTLIIAHRLSTITHADKIIVLKNGEIVEQGNHKDLLKAKGLYTDMWNQQLEQGA